MSYLSSIKQTLLLFIEKEWHDTVDLHKISFDYNTEEKRIPFGDISTNAALVGRGAQTKEQIQRKGESIKAHFAAIPPFHEIVFLPNGFINCFLTTTFYNEMVEGMLKNGGPILTITREPLHYNIEFVSANPTGPLHIGHARGAIIGDVLAKVLRKKGHNVTKEFYINDHGSQIEKLGESFFARYSSWCGIPTEIPEGGYRGEYLNELAEILFKEKGDSLLSSPRSWFAAQAKEAMLKDIVETLRQYGVSFEVWFSENSLYDSGEVEKITDFLLKKEYAYQLPDKSIWFKATLFGETKDWVICRANGAFTYTASDLAYLQNKLQRGFQRLIMILGQDHHGFAQRMKEIAKLFSHGTPLDIILYQMVTVTDQGKTVRLSKRSGNIIALYDIIATVGRDVARFFYLNKDANTHLDFDVRCATEHSEQNPVYYIQYAIVRMHSLLKQAKERGIVAEEPLTDEESSIYEYNEFEKLIIRKIDSADSLFDAVVQFHHPYLIAQYTWQLAALFHSFYAKYPCLSEKNRGALKKRIRLVSLVYRTMLIFTDILGIESPERM